MSASSVRWLALAALFGASVSALAEPVTVYRCTDGKGGVTLRDTPCPRGQQQTTREMLRPQDPPPRPAVDTPAPTPAPPAAPAPTRVVVVQAPRTVYECVGLNGERYTSESAAGNPRWVPLWTLGFPVQTFAPRPHSGSVHGRVEFGGRDVRGRVDIGTPLPPRPPMQRPPPPQPPSTQRPLVTTFPTYTWIRDPCSPLPQQEVCTRMRDRRYALDRRYNSALQSERTQIVEEQRVIDERLAQDCRGY